MSIAIGLQETLHRIDGRQYPRYREVLGEWDLGDFRLIVDHVQGDPFAAPSRVRVRVPSSIGTEILSCPDRRVAAEDWLLRKFARHLNSERCGSGRSGEISVLLPGQEIVERSAIRIMSDGVIEARFRVGLPARGRRILGREAWRLLNEDVRKASAGLSVDESLTPHIDSVLVQRELRRSLRDAGLVAFIADGSILPRCSGVDQAPLHDAVPFVAPESLSVELHAGGETVRGMGVREGVTVIVGGGFHGKSTVLQAIQRGHLDHIPEDGRERVVADPDTVKVRAEDGRRVCQVDISAFLRTLPGGRSTSPFSTDDASGSTSQASSIVEAMESGARLLLLDEDTSATNLLVRDSRMKALIPTEHEPITPFVERVRQIHEECGVSTVLVIGGVGDYLSVADTVIGMVDYVAQDLLSQAKAIAGPPPEPPGSWPAPARRCPDRRGLEVDKIRSRDGRSLSYGKTIIDLAGVETVLDPSHAVTVGLALAALAEQANGQRDVATLLDGVEAALSAEGIDTLSPRETPVGDLVLPRRHEISAALNRCRTLQVRLADTN